MTIPQNPTAALHAVIEPFGLTSEDLDAAEAVADVTLARSVDPKLVPPRNDLDRLLRALRVVFGPGITILLLVGENPVCSLTPSVSEPDLSGYDQIHDAVSLNLHVIIDKDVLLDHWGFASSACSFRLFLSPGRLVEALEVPLFELAQPGNLLEGFQTRAKVVIIAPALSGELSGPFLAILGANAIGNWSQYADAPATARPAPDDVLQHARLRLKWVLHDPSPLTPLHLDVRSKGTRSSADDAVANALFAQWAICCILYLADHSRWDENAKLWLVTFPGDKFSVSASVDMETVRVALASRWERVEALGIVVRWAYRQKSQAADRLTTVQNAIANALEESDAAINCRELIRQAEEISKRADGSWKAFIRQKLDRYFGQVRQLEETIDATSRAYDEQIELLTKSLTDNMLAAVAIVAGSFIAAMLQSPFKPFVFWFGAGAYLLYLSIFPVGIGLTATRTRFNASNRSFTKRKNDCAKRLTKAEVAELVGDTVQKREQAFRCWFAATAVLYVVVIVALAAAMLLVPPLIERWGDQFTLTRISYEMTSPNAVQLQIHGADFDRNKEIVAIVGSKAYSNSAKTIDVYGSSLLTMNVPERDVPRRGERKILPAVTVRQGKAEIKRTLPPR